MKFENSIVRGGMGPPPCVGGGETAERREGVRDNCICYRSFCRVQVLLQYIIIIVVQQHKYHTCTVHTVLNSNTVMSVRL